MAATAKIKIRFSFTRRGVTKKWSTSIHLDTAVPDLTTFEDLADAAASGGTHTLINCFYSDVTIEAVDYYPAGSNVATHSKTIGSNGDRTHTDDTQLSGDTVALWRWSTTARTSKNHPIYLFNYVHGARGRDGTAGDLLNTDQKTAMQNYADRWVAGIVANGITFKRAGPNGAVAQDVTVEQYVTHRDFRK